MSNNYKKAMDKIVMSDELKNKILKSATTVPEKKKPTFFIPARYMSVAACIALCAVLAVFVSGRMSFDDVKVKEADTPKTKVEETIKTEEPVKSENTQKTETVSEVAENSKIKSVQNQEITEEKNEPISNPQTEEVIPYNTPIEENAVEDQAPTDSGVLMARMMPDMSDAVAEEEVEEAVLETDEATTAVYNPMNKVADVEKIEEILGYDIKTPKTESGWYEIESCYVIAETLAEINYVSETNEMTYRTKMGLDNISGDYNSYDTQEEIKIDDMTVSIKGTDGLLNRADWNDGKYSYSIGCEKGMELKEAISIIEGIK